MQEAVNQIKNGIEQCRAKGEFFPMPRFDRKDVHIKEIKLEPLASLLFRTKYRIDFDEGGWIQIEYTSKGKSRLFHTNKNSYAVKVTCSDPSLNFAEDWDEKA